LIFITVGSREYQFDRLLKKIDKIFIDNKINIECFAQIGNSAYIPQNYEYKRFLNSIEFETFQNKATLIISHGGTGSLMTAIKKGKKVIGVPRNSAFKEHVDNHQFQIIETLTKQGFIVSDTSSDLNQLENFILNKDKIRTKPYNSINKIHQIILDFLNDNKYNQ